MAPGSRIKADEVQLRQLLVNLATNPQDAMKDGGVLRIGAAIVPLLAASGSAKIANFVSFTVEDTGTGILPVVQQRMYDPFYSNKESGRSLGLGLAISRMIAQQNVGWLDCESGTGIGTKFTLYLPCVDEAVARRRAKRESVEMPRGHETVLIIEEQPMVADLISTLLRNLGYRPILARCEDSAKRAISAENKIDRLITDFSVSQIGGEDLIERIRLSYPEVRVIATSVTGIHEGAETTGEALDFLSRPFRIEASASKVRSALR